MKNNDKWIGLVIMLSLFLIWGQMPAMADEEKAEFEAELKPGFDVVGTSDLKSPKVGEYEVLDKGLHPTLEFSLSGNRGSDHFDFSGEFIEEEDQSYELDIDFRRIVNQEFSYTRFMHWLDHDPLDNLYGAFSGMQLNDGDTYQGVVIDCPGGAGTCPDAHCLVTNTDFDSGEDYHIIHSETKSKTTVALPFIPGGSIGFDYRREMRDGHRQSLTMSKCSSCHVQSHSRQVHEITEDYQPSIAAKFGKARAPQLAIEYSFLFREFDEEGEAPLNTYDSANNPRLIGSRPFGDRLWYEGEELEYDQVPEMEKQMHSVKAQGSVPKMNTTLFAGYVNSNVENTDMGIETASDTVSCRISNTSVPGLALNAGFRWMEIDNDDYLVDYIEPTGANPDYSGTYESFYGVGGAGEGDPPFTWPYIRESALSRDSYTADFSARYVITPGFSVRGSYKWNKIDRDHFLVDEGETETEQDTYKLGFNARVGRARLRAGYTYEDTDYPFANSAANEQGGVCEALGSQATTGNWRLGEQYYEFWATRQADMSNLAEKKHEVLANLTVPLRHNLSLSANYRWQDEDTVSGEGQVNMPSASLWYAPHPKLSFTLTYLYDDETRTSRLCLPVFNG
jgi:hypothetical protein